MSFLRFAVIAAVAGSLGCQAYLTADYLVPPQPQLEGENAADRIVLLEGTTAAVTLKARSSDAVVTDARSDDPRVLGVAPPTGEILQTSSGTPERAVVIYAVAPGTTKIRAYDGAREVGTFPVEVLAR
jgi:hypothetical protein